MKVVINHPSAILDLIWIGWLTSWVAASSWSGLTQKRIATLPTWTYRTAMIAGGILLIPLTPWLLAEERIWEVGYVGAYALAGLMLLGLAFTWWARIYLGRLWSSAITRKEGHRIIDTGPYALVRHPIYTGLIIALLATAAAEGRVTALLGAALIIFGLWLKARSEERFLTVELGTDAYVSYCRRVPMLIPFLWHR